MKITRSFGGEEGEYTEELHIYELYNSIHFAQKRICSAKEVLVAAKTCHKSAWLQTTREAGFQGAQVDNDHSF